jgi:hypothetical protein
MTASQRAMATAVIYLEPAKLKRRGSSVGDYILGAYGGLPPGPLRRFCAAWA